MSSKLLAALPKPSESEPGTYVVLEVSEGGDYRVIERTRHRSLATVWLEEVGPLEERQLWYRNRRGWCLLQESMGVSCRLAPIDYIA